MKKRAHKRPHAIPTKSWARALTADTILATIPATHLDWLAHAPAGSMLVRSDGDRAEIGHVYPEVAQAPPGWTALAQSGGTP